MVRREFDPTVAVTRLEEHNHRAGRSQVIMDLLTLKSLLKLQDFTDTDNFWMLVKDHLDALTEEKERLLLADMPIKYLRMIKNELIYDLQVPKVGEKAAITIPIYEVAAAVDAGCRIADAMKVKKSDLTIGMVNSRIDREIDKEMKAYKKLVV